MEEQLPAPGIQELLNDPSWLPHACSLSAHTLTFAQITRERQRQVTFLHDEQLRNVAKSPPIPLAELPRDSIAAAAQPLHFIVHTGFSCSTLLCRALDVPGISMALKEPRVLTDFAEPILARQETPALRAALDVALDLLSRSSQGHERQIVKTTYSDVVLIPHVAQRTNSKFLFLHASLEEFVQAIAQREFRGRAFIRWLYARLKPALALPTGYGAADEFALTDLQVAALVWLMQMVRFKAIMQELGSARAQSLSADRFLADREASLQALATFFELNAPSSAWTSIANGAIFQEHAKQPTRAFNAADRAAQRSKVLAGNAAEIGALKPWVTALSEYCRSPFDLGNTLLGI